MPRRGAKDLTVGALFALALIVLAVTIMAVGGETRLFAKKASYSVIFPDATGLTVGSPVKMAGVQIGTVSAIRLSTDPQQVGIEVVVGVDEAFAGRIREDSRAALRILQLLSGEKFVEIVAGTPDQQTLPRNSKIETLQDVEILKQAALAAENINDITVSLKNILETLESGEGLIGQMLGEPEFGKDGLEALSETVQNLKRLTDDLLQGRTPKPGFLSRVLYDQEFAATIDDLGQAFEKVAEILAAVDPQTGAVGALIQPDGAGQQAIEDLREAAASVRRITARLESDTGLIGRLLNDEAYSEGLARDLRTTMGNLAEISEKINSGQGTLGALVNERVLHDGMEDVVAGVNDSKFARWLMRRYQKKGIKAADQQAGGSGDPGP